MLSFISFMVPNIAHYGVNLISRNGGKLLGTELRDCYCRAVNAVDYRLIQINTVERNLAMKEESASTFLKCKVSVLHLLLYALSQLPSLSQILFYYYAY